MELPDASDLALLQEELELLDGLTGAQEMQVQLQRRRVLRVVICSYI